MKKVHRVRLPSGCVLVLDDDNGFSGLVFGPVHAAALRRARGYRGAMRRALAVLNLQGLNEGETWRDRSLEAAEILWRALPARHKAKAVKRKVKRDMPGTYGP